MVVCNLETATPFFFAEREPPPYSNTSISSSQHSFDAPGGPLTTNGSYNGGGYGSESDYGTTMPSHHQYAAPPHNVHTYSDIDMPGQEDEQ